MALRTDLSSRDRLILLLIALPFLLAGLYIVGIGMHWIPSDPAKMHAPGWVIALCGLPFVGAGVAILDFTRSRNSPTFAILGISIFLGIVLVTHWVAFGSGSRQFTHTRTLNGVVLESEPMDEQTGRKYFAVGAVVLDLMFATGLVVSMRKRARPTARRD